MPRPNVKKFVYSAEERGDALRSLARRCRDLAEVAEYVAANDDDVAGGLLFGLFDAVPAEIQRVRIIEDNSPLDAAPSVTSRKK